MENSKAYREYVHNKKVKEVVTARKFFEDKLEKSPYMPRYNHMLAAIKAAGGDMDGATRHYRNALAEDPNNIMLASDTALHYSKVRRQQDAIDEFKKTLLFNPKNPMLQKNMAAVYARTGRYEEAREHAQVALYADEDDPMNHRNIAAVHEMLGDTRQALIHNVKSINMEQGHANITPSTVAYRAAARQTIARGGKITDGVALLSAARSIEGKKYKSATTMRTYEILSSIAKRRGNQLLEMKKEEEALMKKRDAENAIRNGDVSELIPDAHTIIRGPPRPLPAGRRKKKKAPKLTEEEKTLKELNEEEDDENGRHKQKHKSKEHK